MKRIFAFALVAAMLLLAACGGTTPAPTPTPSSDGSQSQPAPTAGIAKEDIKVGFIYVGPIGDEGYSFAHDQGRKELEAMGIATTYVENVPETADCEKTIRDLIDQGCNVIVATSFGFGQFTLNAAKDFPEVYFFHCSGNLTNENMTAYFGRAYEARYLSGIAAGLKTKSNKIGYVAAMPIPEVVRGANAFALGVKSVNPNATVEVVWTNTWYDPALEKQAAVQLLNNGCDVLGQHCDTTAPQIAAQEKGAFAVGYNAATLSAAPNAYLTAPMWHWGSFYTKAVQSVIDGTYKSEFYWGAMSSGIVGLDALSANCAEGTAEAVKAAQDKILAGELHPFSGPLKDNQGNVKVGAGATMTDEEMWNMMWFVDNIIGTVPN